MAHSLPPPVVLKQLRSHTTYIALDALCHELFQHKLSSSSSSEREKFRQTVGESVVELLERLKSVHHGDKYTNALFSRNLWCNYYSWFTASERKSSRSDLNCDSSNAPLNLNDYSNTCNQNFSEQKISSFGKNTFTKPHADRQQKHKKCKYRIS